MLGFHSISAAPVSARRDLSTTQPGDPFNLTDGLDESLETLDLDAGQLSFYQQIDDDVAAVLDLTLVYILDVTFDEADDPVSFYQANEDDPVVAPETLPTSFDLDEVIDQDPQDLSFYQANEDELTLSPTSFDLDDSLNQDSSDSPDLSFYQQLDDDLAVQPDTLLVSFDYADEYGLLDDDTSFYQQLDDDAAVAQPDALFGSFDYADDTGLFDDDTSFYSQLDDDAAVAQPDALFGNFDFIDETGLFDDATSFYYQADDDVVVVTPPVTSAGGVARHYVISGERGRKSEREPPAKPDLQPFDVTLAKQPLDLKSLSDRLFDLGKQLGKNKQAVKDQIKAEQAAAKAAKDAKIVVILQLIQLFELELYNQNARRLLLILAEDRA